MKMKTTNYYFLMVAILSAGFISCNNDDDPKPPPPPEGNVTVQLKVLDGTPTSYASTETEPPETGESTLSSQLEVFVFDVNGSFEYYQQLGYDSGTNLTDRFQVTAGPKYFYVFSNLPGNVPAPGQGTTRVTFEETIRTAVVTNLNTSISVADQFFIGTLWGDTVRVNGTGTLAAPENIAVSVGRIASKIRLKETVSSASGNLKGTFADPFYRVASIPTEFYMVGQHNGLTMTPPRIPPADGVQVFSAVHNEPANSTKFTEYLFPTTSNIGTAYYTIENTTAADMQGHVYFGNTTHIQFRVKYVPDASEVYSGSTGDPGGTITGSGDFYTGIRNGSRFIYDSNPIGLGDVTDIKIYTGGLNYYNIPIKDLSESTISLQTSIIRNHYYELRITSISRLGEDSGTVDPETPITEDKDIQLSITVLPWSKIIYDIPL